MTRALITYVLAAAVGIAGGCGAPPSVAMVSGRDDHGLLERSHLGLQRSPSDPEIVGTVGDGTFVTVERRDGPWALVRAAGRDDAGWIEDHYLRGEAVRHDPPPARRVRFLAIEQRSGEIYVRVRSTEDGSEEWVRAGALREVGAEP